ncbi:hypothetical protein KAR91_67095 [Candidatus Pacearchaeota archaeon]|nr:hypothetical protein [Candidatus Pacearchaeota archaeon]
MIKFKLIVTLLFILCIGLASIAYPCSKCHQAPPKGYLIVTNGIEFRFISPNGKISFRDTPTVEDAISAAWRKKKNRE